MGRPKEEEPKPCTIDGCDRRHVARGLCGSHYNQAHAKNRHKKKLTPCTYCGKPTLKGTGGGRKNGAVCSTQCRQWLTTPYCILPPDHWARWWGKTSPWSPPADRPPAFIANQCDECGTQFIEATCSVPSSYCSRTCQGRVAKRARRARECGSYGTFRWVDVIALWIAAGKRCGYCDQVTEQPEPDHVIPLSRGGANNLGNILPVCHACNCDKCDMTLTEWEEERERLGKKPLRYELPFTNPRFRHLTEGIATGTAWRHALAA